MFFCYFILNKSTFWDAFEDSTLFFAFYRLANLYDLVNFEFLGPVIFSYWLFLISGLNFAL